MWLTAREEVIGLIAVAVTAAAVIVFASLRVWWQSRQTEKALDRIWQRLQQRLSDEEEDR